MILNHQLLFILSILLFLNQVITYTCKNYKYSYHMLVMNWPYEYCYHHKCKENLPNLGVANQWIIRGLWPASTDLDFLNCIQYNGKDPNCNVAYAYNESLFTGSLKNDLNKYWTEIDVSNDLKSNQWQMHGTCYLSIIQTLNTSTIGSEAQIFQSYFADSIKKINNINLTLNKQNVDSKEQLAKILGVGYNQFNAFCEYDPDYLSQVRLCYDIKSTAGNQSLISCPISEPNQCEFPIKIRQNKFESVIKLTSLIILFFFFLIN